MIAIWRDLTEQRELEERTAQAAKLETLGQLAGGVAHDFNNLLTVILGCADWAAHQVGATHPLCADLRQIQAAAERGAQLTHQLLAFGRKQPRRPVPLDLNRSLVELEGLLRRLIPENIELVWELDPMLGSTLLDPLQLQQVVLNLVANARDAMPEGGTLTLRTRHVPRDPSGAEAANAWVALEVADTGVGMDPVTVTRIFEPFFTTKEPGRGTGLGLSTVYGIVQQNGGRIEVESAPGRGSRFTIYLPQLDVPRAEVAVQATEGSRGPRGPGGETILLVEDEEGVRGLARRVLERSGYRVMEAATPGQALALVNEQDAAVDLLLTDLIMPGMSGCELAAQVRERRPGLRVMVMTGHVDEARVGSLPPSDVVVLTKPFDSATLLRKVREALELS